MQAQVPLGGLSPSLWTDFQVIFGLSPGASTPFHASIASLQSYSKDIFLDSLAFSAYAAGVSIVILLLQLILRSAPVRKLHAKFSPSETTLVNGHGIDEISTEDDLEPAPHVGHVAQLGGPVIFAFKFARLLSCFALLGMSVSTTTFYIRGDLVPHAIKPSAWLHIALSGTLGYASLLALLSVTVTSTKTNTTVTRHLVFVLGAVWAIYIYRDIWPLATYVLPIQDKAESGLLWAKLVVSTFAAVIVPFFIPRQYVPVDSKDPWQPVAEQTSSIMSMMLYVWLDKTVIDAYQIPHLPIEKLPALADYDSAKHLVKRSFKHLDPFQVGTNRHLFWGLMRVFRTDYLVLALMLTLETIFQLSSPVGINQLLRYLETGGEDAFVRPWVWISWLFFGPLFSSIALQWYIFNTTRMLVRATGIVTQLVFEHSLRIRMKAETQNTPGNSVASTAVPTPDNASIAEGSESQITHESPTSSEDETMQASTVSVDSSSVKGKQKSKAASVSGDSKKSADDSPAVSGPKGENLIGKINNLVTTDLDNIIGGRDFLFFVVQVPLQLGLCVWFLYHLLGWSAFTGMAVMVIMFPLPGYIASKIQVVQVEKMKKTDARVESVTEIMNVIRMVKLFGWEPRVAEQLSKKREDELRFQWKYRLLGLVNDVVNHVIPFITMIVTYVTFTLIMKKELTASVVFSSMAVFDMLRQTLHGVFGFLPAVIRAKVSLDRVTEFLHKTELLDQYSLDSKDADLVLPPALYSDEAIGIKNASFTWASTNDGSSTPGTPRRNFTFRVEDEVKFQQGKINLIIGPTGSGKTSLLMALLGEMHYIPSGPDSFVNLPRAGGVAYAAQESWVQNETIRDNILFGQPYDEVRYNKVIDQCGLRRDLSLFEAGDQTEVGEKGLTLSGGQKARITLARAVYSPAQILLLDDVLAALDVHTAKWIIDKCFKGELIRDRTVLLVTHNVAMATPIAQFVVSLGTDGRILSQGALSTALSKDKKLLKELSEENKEIEKAEQAIDESEPAGEAKKADGKLIVAEEVSVGHVSWKALTMFFSSLGGRHQVFFWFMCVGTQVLAELASTIQTWFLGFWARQYEDHDASEVKVPFYLSVYSMLLLATVIAYSIGWIVYVYGALRASRSIHKTLITWLDMTPTSRIITRCTQDIAAVDGPITEYFRAVAEISLAMLIKLAAVVVMSPIFLIPGVLIAILGGWCGQIYMKAQLSVKREMSNARAPVLGHFGAAIAGLTSIRAYGAEEMFRKESHERINRYTRAARTFYNLNRWVCIRIDTLGSLFASGLATYLVYGSGLRASNIGFSLNMAVGFSGMILWWVRLVNEFEVSGNSLERIEQYVQIEQEVKPTERGVPPAYWPASGDLKVEKLSARYSQDGPHVLHEISFEVKSGERVGIVGRTGSGKSSLTLSLLRCILTEGKVYYDGMPTDSVNLDALRSNITIIPQVPELLSGTLRQNLDPFEQHDDSVLNDALRSAGLFSLQSETEEGRITLDSQISSGGSNLSVGQRQILALARAIVRQSKLLILDEATSAIDYATDTVIQTSLRKELNKDVTLLTVAHRLQTIMDADKIMVLDAGRIVEFGKPSELLKNEKGMLRALVDESGDRDALYAMAEGSGASTENSS
ncbi:uncharacterized protein FIBRA_03559 [Fibroporia radiculosa]|uniref:P-loop containing nucleoside triphosphate hydrolase protein n=1 Tax=Fibroporia radiculosa TaxID=599839 RepID=J4G5V7_9APHY|nr:uncharacterized protein FIBRA_03559 [Fibroporia radiculosa]CCM01503.1 predicted protein [Fibroporia radiculosa]